jgi:hypothetical protein
MIRDERQHREYIHALMSAAHGQLGGAPVSREDVESIATRATVSKGDGEVYCAMRFYPDTPSEHAPFTGPQTQVEYALGLDLERKVLPLVLECLRALPAEAQDAPVWGVMPLAMCEEWRTRIAPGTAIDALDGGMAVISSPTVRRIAQAMAKRLAEL